MPFPSSPEEVSAEYRAAPDSTAQCAGASSWTKVPSCAYWVFVEGSCGPRRSASDRAAHARALQDRVVDATWGHAVADGVERLTRPFSAR